MEAKLVGAERRISSLPTETLLDIFDHCRVKYYDFTLDSISVRGGPLSVTSVCQRWRHVALSTPTLWTDVHLNIYPHPLGDVIARRNASAVLRLPTLTCLKRSSCEGHDHLRQTSAQDRIEMKSGVPEMDQ